MSSSRVENRITSALTATLLAASLGSTPSAQEAGRPTATQDSAGVVEHPRVWITAKEIAVLPRTGRAWKALLKAADKPVIAPSIADRNSNDDVITMAKALAYVATGEPQYRAQVLLAIGAAMGTERQGDVLALGRNLPGYVIAADLVGLGARLEPTFEKWLRSLPDWELQGTTLRRVHERRPNNWGTHAGGARAVIASYLGDEAELERIAQVFRGWLGESTYAGFEFGDPDWQANPAQPVGVNPKGATRDGHSIDGVLPDDQRRSGAFAWPPPQENYVYEALQGALLQAMVLSREGYDCWQWGDRALLRAALWLERQAGYPAQGDDQWQPYVINYHYADANLRLVLPAHPGKNVGWTDWTHFQRPTVTIQQPR